MELFLSPIPTILQAANPKCTEVCLVIACNGKVIHASNVDLPLEVTSVILLVVSRLCLK